MAGFRDVIRSLIHYFKYIEIKDETSVEDVSDDELKFRTETLSARKDLKMMVLNTAEDLEQQKSLYRDFERRVEKLASKLKDETTTISGMQVAKPVIDLYNYALFYENDFDNGKYISDNELYRFCRAYFEVLEARTSDGIQLNRFIKENMFGNPDMLFSVLPMLKVLNLMGAEPVYKKYFYMDAQLYNKAIAELFNNSCKQLEMLLIDTDCITAGKVLSTLYVQRNEFYDETMNMVKHGIPDEFYDEKNCHQFRIIWGYMVKAFGEITNAVTCHCNEYSVEDARAIANEINKVSDKRREDLRRLEITFEKGKLDELFARATLLSYIRHDTLDELRIIQENKRHVKELSNIEKPYRLLDRNGCILPEFQYPINELSSERLYELLEFGKKINQSEFNKRLSELPKFIEKLKKMNLLHADTSQLYVCRAAYRVMISKNLFDGHVAKTDRKIPKFAAEVDSVNEKKHIKSTTLGGHALNCAIIAELYDGDKRYEAFVIIFEKIIVVMIDALIKLMPLISNTADYDERIECLYQIYDDILKIIINMK